MPFHGMMSQHKPQSQPLIVPSWYEEEMFPGTYTEVYELFKQYLDEPDDKLTNGVCKHINEVFNEIGKSECQGFCKQF